MGYGAMEITATYNAPLPDDVALDLLEGIQRLGLTFYDTAEVYTRISFGKFYKVPPNQTSEWYNEAILGRHLRRLARGSFTVGTKYNPFAHSGRCDHATVAAALDASLARLGLDFVDVYYLHRMPATLKLLDEAVARMAVQASPLNGRFNGRHPGHDEPGARARRRGGAEAGSR